MSLCVGVVDTHYPDSYFKKVQLNLWNKDAKKNIHVGLKAED